MGAARAEVAADLAGVEGGGAAASGEERGRGSEVGGHNTNGAPPLGAP